MIKVLGGKSQESEVGIPFYQPIVKDRSDFSNLIAKPKQRSIITTYIDCLDKEGSHVEFSQIFLNIFHLASSSPRLNRSFYVNHGSRRELRKETKLGTFSRSLPKGDWASKHFPFNRDYHFPLS